MPERPKKSEKTRERPARPDSHNAKGVVTGGKIHRPPYDNRFPKPLFSEKIELSLSSYFIFLPFFSSN